MAYDDGTVLAVAAPRECWLFTNSPAQHGLVVVIVASDLASVSSGRSRNVIVRGEWLSIVCYLLPRSRPHCPTSCGRVRDIGCGRFVKS
jgi:hypothetical protein